MARKIADKVIVTNTAAQLATALGTTVNTVRSARVRQGSARGHLVWREDDGRWYAKRGKPVRKKHVIKARPERSRLIDDALKIRTDADIKALAKRYGVTRPTLLGWLGDEEMMLVREVRFEPMGRR